MPYPASQIQQAELSLEDAVAELERRTTDPLRLTLGKLTESQVKAHLDPAPTVIIRGGNQSGKSLTAVCDVLARAAETVWYCTTTFDLFAQQAYEHFKTLLLYPGESINQGETAKILRVDWLRPGVPKGLYLRNGQVITIKSYEQGAGEFQAKNLRHAVVDEECPDSIWDELQARFYASPCPRIVVAATPRLGVGWFERLCQQAETGAAGVSLHVLKTLENPGRNQEQIDREMERLRDRPEEIALRLEGVPYHMTGLIYPDGLWKREHVVEPFYLDPKYYSFYRCIDHGFNYCACLWCAVSRDQDSFVVYREYLGRERKLSDNAAHIQALSRMERYAETYIDPATLGTDAETGLRMLDLWRRHFLVRPAPDNRVHAGIERVKELLASSGGPDGQRPGFRVFNTCLDFLRERRNYRWGELREEGDEGKEKPVKREDHLMDCWRYLVCADLKYVRVPEPVPKDELGKLFWEQRHPEPEEKL